jgi:hypothetical protein
VAEHALQTCLSENGEQIGMAATIAQQAELIRLQAAEIERLTEYAKWLEKTLSGNAVAALKQAGDGAGSEGSAAQKSFWAGFEAAKLDDQCSNIRTAWNEFKGSDQFKRLNASRYESSPERKWAHEVGQSIRIDAWRQHEKLSYWTASLITNDGTDLSITGPSEHAAVLAVMDMFVAGCGDTDHSATPRPTGLSRGWNLTRQCDGFVVGHSSAEPSKKHKDQALADGRVYVPLLVSLANGAADINMVKALDRLDRVTGVFRECERLASSYSGCIDGVEEHGGDDHEDPTCAIWHRLYYAMFDADAVRKELRALLAGGAP